MARDELLVGFRVPPKPPKDGGLVGIGVIGRILAGLIQRMVERGLYGCCKFEQPVCPRWALVNLGDEWDKLSNFGERIVAIGDAVEPLLGCLGS